MPRSVGVTDEIYDRIKEKAEEAGVSMQEIAVAALAYGLDRLSVKLVISFSENNGVFKTDSYAVPVKEEEEAPRPRVHPNAGVATRLGPTAGTTEIVRQLLKEMGRPMNVIEIRRALQEKYPDRILSPNIGASIQSARGIRKNTDTVPHTYVYEP